MQKLVSIKIYFQVYSTTAVKMQNIYTLEKCTIKWLKFVFMKQNTSGIYNIYVYGPPSFQVFQIELSVIHVSVQIVLS